MLHAHREADASQHDTAELDKATQRLGRLKREAAQLRTWLAAHPGDRCGASGSIRQSNRTDNDSAKMASSKGVIQGYTGVAAVDERCQIIVEAQAHGTGSEQELLGPVVDGFKDLTEQGSILTADAGYHSEANRKRLADQHIEALIADKDMRQRDERFAEQGQHEIKLDPIWDKTRKDADAPSQFRPQDFVYDPQTQTCICPAGEFLYQNGRHVVIQGREAIKFTGAQRVCGPCNLRDQCLRHPKRTAVRQVVFFNGKKRGGETHTDRMKRKIDSEAGRKRYAQRFATVEPVFANIRHNKQLNRFTLRGRIKVDTQWKLYCMVHNIEKLAHYGYGR